MTDTNAIKRFWKCTTCGHAFDGHDHRGFVPATAEDRRLYGVTCPACQITKSIGAEAWAIWNRCQGVFACSVFHRRREAREALAKAGWENEEVVPVRVFRETADQEWYRVAREDEWERGGERPRPLLRVVERGSPST